MATWVLNDETKANVYGFRVLNSGIDLERFKQNPVMLAMHKDWDLASVIGRWTNIRVEGHLLLADDEFDMEDEEAAKISGKVKRGFLKACSMGFLFLQEHLQKAIDGMFDLVESELLEASLVTIPGNSNAVRLYAAPGKLMDEKEIKLSLSAVMANPTTTTHLKTNNNMEKFTLSGPALALLLGVGLTNQENADSVNAAIVKLGADLQAEKDAHGNTKQALQAMKDAQLSAAKKAAENDVEAAILSGKLTAGQKDQFVKLYLSDPELAKSVLANMPGKKSLGASVNGSPEGGNAADPKTLDEFEKLSLSAQLAFKESNPEGYQALFAR